MINPVLRREIKTSMRSWKNFLAIVIYLIVMLAIMAVFSFANSYSSIGIDLTQTNYFYVGLASIQLGFILFAAPALTASSISGERERQTLDLMLITKMKAISIVTGKLMASLSIIILMTVTAMPVFALMMNYGGVSLFQVVQVFLLFVLIACMVGSAGIFFSSLVKKTAVATMLTYIFVMFIFGVNFILGILYLNSISYSVDGVYKSINPFLVILFFGTNPLVGFMDIIQNQMGWEIISGIASEFTYGRTAEEILVVQWLERWIGTISIAANFIASAAFLALGAYNIKPVKKKLFKKK